MINPWQDLFNNWLESFTSKEDEMKRYYIEFETRSRTSFSVSARNESEAIEIAQAMLPPEEIQSGDAIVLFEDWEVSEVDYDYDN